MSVQYGPKIFYMTQEVQYKISCWKILKQSKKIILCLSFRRKKSYFLHTNQLQSVTGYIVY